ncbi:MAG: DUF418 domain-containing protein [Betaproteobacteria bacterium]|nr:DUF418 domain-containing protein [Betaproteobacteria bacterium]
MPWRLMVGAAALNPTESSVEPQRQRDLHIDALRGFALFGILVVNVMSFSSGLSGPSLGVLNAESSWADLATFLIIAFFAEFKFYPIFAFLFGYGFLLFWRRARWRGGDVSALYNRRVWFLGLLGVSHGVFIWFGDILSRYAVTAIFLKKSLSARPRQLLRTMKNWLIAAAAIAFLFAFASGNMSTDGGMPPAPSIYPTGTYLQVTQQRFSDYFAITLYFGFLIPQVMVIFLAGVLTARMGWLARPARHRAFWLKVLKAGLVLGVPASVAWAALQWQGAWSASAVWSTWMPVLDLIMPLQSAAMMAALALTLHTPFMQSLVRWLAPAGRMPLTNYLAQSVICSFVLYGYGLGLGDDLRQSGLAALAVSVYLAQIVVSRWWLARHDSGPMEAWWRRVVYGRRAG